METIGCHDCGKPVSSSAVACPHCGSREPAGPYRHSRSEIRRHRIEERNDRTLFVLTLAAGVIGGFYGIETSSSRLGAFMIGPLYGFIGATIGVSLAFALNVTRNWR